MDMETIMNTNDILVIENVIIQLTNKLHELKSNNVTRTPPVDSCFTYKKKFINSYSSAKVRNEVIEHVDFKEQHSTGISYMWIGDRPFKKGVILNIPNFQS